MWNENNPKNYHVNTGYWECIFDCPQQIMYGDVWNSLWKIKMPSNKVIKDFNLETHAQCFNCEKLLLKRDISIGDETIMHLKLYAHSLLSVWIRSHLMTLLEYLPFLWFLWINWKDLIRLFFNESWQRIFENLLYFKNIK